MKPLLEIKSVPISLEYKVNSAQFKQADSATLEVSRGSKGYRMRSRPIKMNVDTIEANRRQLPRTGGRAVSDNRGIAQKPPVRNNVASYSATAHMLDNGQIQVDMQFNSEAIAQISSQIQQAHSSAEYVPNYPTDTGNYEPKNLSVTYEIDKLSFDWAASSKNIEFEFVPASIEFQVAQYPSVVIEYVGDPIYVPPSANPDYEPVDSVV